MTRYASQQLRSNNRSIYAEQNDPLTVVSVNGLVAIVETAKGNRFPCLVELLSDDRVVVVVEPTSEPAPFDLFNQNL